MKYSFYRGIVILNIAPKCRNITEKEKGTVMDVGNSYLASDSSFF